MKRVERPPFGVGRTAELHLLRGTIGIEPLVGGTRAVGFDFRRRRRRVVRADHATRKRSAPPSAARLAVQDSRDIDLAAPGKSRVLAPGFGSEDYQQAPRIALVLVLGRQRHARRHLRLRPAKSSGMCALVPRTIIILLSLWVILSIPPPGPHRRAPMAVGVSRVSKTADRYLAWPGNTPNRGAIGGALGQVHRSSTARANGARTTILTEPPLAAVVGAIGL